MPSKLDTSGDPQELVEIAPNVVLVARAAAEFPTLAPEDAGHAYERHPNMGAGAASAEPAPRVDTSFRASDVNEVSRLRSSGGRWAKTAGLAFAFAFVSALGTAAWERYGDEAQAFIADFTPRLELAAWLPKPLAASIAQPDPSPLPSNANNQAAATTTAPAESGASGTTAAAQTMAPEAVQMLQSVSHDVASLTQQVEALKASIAELKASQDQISRDMTKVREVKLPEPRLSEAKPVEPRPTKLGAPPRSLGAIVQHKPRPAAYPIQGASANAAPLMPPPGSTAPPPIQNVQPPASSASGPVDDVVVRPPMPVR
jgi:hypothetical protein